MTLVCGLLYSQATLTELTGDIQATQRELVEAQSEYNYLSGVLDSKTGLKNVEEIATTQLGLMKLDRSQITYFFAGRRELDPPAGQHGKAHYGIFDHQRAEPGGVPGPPEPSPESVRRHAWLSGPVFTTRRRKWNDHAEYAAKPKTKHQQGLPRFMRIRSYVLLGLFLLVGCGC